MKKIILIFLLIPLFILGDAGGDKGFSLSAQLVSVIDDSTILIKVRYTNNQPASAIMNGVTAPFFLTGENHNGLMVKLFQENQVVASNIEDEGSRVQSSIQPGQSRQSVITVKLDRKVDFEKPTTIVVSHQDGYMRNHKYVLDMHLKAEPIDLSEKMGSIHAIDTYEKWCEKILSGNESVADYYVNEQHGFDDFKLRFVFDGEMPVEHRDAVMEALSRSDVPDNKFVKEWLLSEDLNQPEVYFALRLLPKMPSVRQSSMGENGSIINRGNKEVNERVSRLTQSQPLKYRLAVIRSYIEIGPFDPQKLKNLYSKVSSSEEKVFLLYYIVAFDPEFTLEQLDKLSLGANFDWELYQKVLPLQYVDSLEAHLKYISARAQLKIEDAKRLKP